MTATRGTAGLMVVCSLLVLAGCDRKDVDKAPVIRPVLSIVATPKGAQRLSFTGSVQPRYSVGLGFRQVGRMISRDVEVGDQVKAGVSVAAIDATPLELAVRSSLADLATARAKLTNATGAESRQRTLLRQGVVAQAQYDSAQLGLGTATAGVQSAEANLAKAQDQLKYAQLRSDTDGVVTAISGQVGQVVQAGQVVVTVARPDVREAVIDVPEDVAAELTVGVTFDVALQIDPSILLQGPVREIAPEADATTRARRVRISMPNPNAAFRLGTTITAMETTPTATWIELPRSALLEQHGKNFVWVIDPNSSTVSTREVTISRANDISFRVNDGLADGDRVVTAGVHSLSPGQHVKLPGKAAS